MVVLGFMLVPARLCLADEVTDDMVSNPEMMNTIKALGALAFFGQTPEHADQNRADLKNNFWAFKSDVHLTDAQIAAETKHLDAIWDSLVKISADHDVTEVSFIGCDTLGLVKCTDMYYVAATTSGPILIKYSMVFGVGDSARMFDVQIYTDWDKVKQMCAGIQHTVNRDRVPTITPKPDKSKKAPEAVDGRP
jgi:hypothetical protein